MRGSEPAGSAGSRPVTWTARLVSACRPMVTASVTNMACFASNSPMAGRASCPTIGSPTAIPGNWRAASSPIPSGSAEWSNISAATAILRGASGIRRRRWTQWPMTRRSWAGAGATSIRCDCGRRARETRFSLRRSTRATSSARSPRARTRRRSLACSIPAMPRRLAASSACGRSISSRRPRCRTSCAAISCNTEACTHSRIRRPSSSTRPMLRSPLRSSCASSSTSTSSLGKMLGASAPRH